MYKYASLYLVCILFFSACSEKETGSDKYKVVTTKQVTQGLSILPQPYYSLLNDLEIDENVLRELHLTQYKADYFFNEGDATPFKQTFTSIKPQVGKTSFYILQKNKNKQDTLVKEICSTIKGNTESYQRDVNSAQGGVNRFEVIRTFNAQHQLISKTQINKSNQRKNIENYSYQQNNLTKKELVGLGEELYISINDSTLRYVLRKTNGDTLRSSIRIKTKNQITERFIKGGKDEFNYVYDQDKLIRVLWTDAGKVMAEFSFDYDEKGILKTRKTKSSVPAFPSNITRYRFE